MVTKYRVCGVYGLGQLCSGVGRSDKYKGLPGALLGSIFAARGSVEPDSRHKVPGYSCPGRTPAVSDYRQLKARGFALAGSCSYLKYTWQGPGSTGKAAVEFLNVGH